MNISFRVFSTAVISTSVIFLIILSIQLWINEGQQNNLLVVEHVDVKFEYGEQRNITIDAKTNDTKENKEEVFIVFVIPIKPTDFERRQVIRETWANPSSWIDFNEKTNTTFPQDEFYRRFAIMFIMADPDLEYKAASRDKEESDDETTEKGEEGEEGEEEAEDEPDISELLKEEAERYGDIYDVDGLDEGYRMIKDKVLWGMRQSLVLYKATYIIKTDGDILVNMPVLIRRLKLASRTGLYTGACYVHIIEPTVREYLKTHGIKTYGRFPNWKYCLGGGYILSRDVVERIMELSVTLSREVGRIPIIAEDMYTGYLVDKLQDPPVPAVGNNGWIQLGLDNVDPLVLNTKVRLDHARAKIARHPGFERLELLCFASNRKMTLKFGKILVELNDTPFLPAAEYKKLEGHFSIRCGAYV
eukprot:sb/3479713/